MKNKKGVEFTASMLAIIIIIIIGVVLFLLFYTGQFSTLSTSFSDVSQQAISNASN